MADLSDIVARVKDALGSSARGDLAEIDANGAPLHALSANDRAELATQFGHELKSVAGDYLGICRADEAAARIAALAAETGVRTAAIGEGVAIDTGAIATALETEGISVLRTAPGVDADNRTQTLRRVADADMGIAEADCAIASTGTLAVVSTVSRPSSLTLLPPSSVILVNVDRLVRDIAAAVATLGANEIANHRVTLITGPSRTADIEKRIVLGVHGPKSLHVLIVWPRDE